MSTLDHETSNIEQDKARRDFIRNSALVAGAAAAIGISSTASAQDVKLGSLASSAELGKSRRLTAVFDARYQDKITKEDIWIVLEQMFDIAGCPTCGLGGFDWHLAINPIFDVKANIPVQVAFQQ